ncbi:C40 family peptidase [Vibrio sp. FNV 38]|nr:C40 family peptidase [Vibrio sp. FNV 38]
MKKRFLTWFNKPNVRLKQVLPFSLVLLSTACSSNVPYSSSPPLKTDANPPNTQMISFARNYLGSDYQWGGNTPKGFDCSGFIKFVYNEFDIDIPRTTSQYPTLYANKVAFSDAEVGDLIIFTGTNPKVRKPGHAGIITQVGDGKLHFIHSSSSKKHYGVTETNYFKSGYPKRYLSIVRMSDASG